MWNLEYTESSRGDLEKIDFLIQKRIIKKIDFFITSENPLYFVEKLTDSIYGEYRFRVGDYRIIFDVDVEEKIVIIAVIGHRKEIYK